MERDLADVLRRWADLKSSDLPALNQQLKNAGTPEIRAEVNPENQQDRGDDD
jgi:hypothetical protein